MVAAIRRGSVLMSSRSNSTRFGEEHGGRHRRRRRSPVGRRRRMLQRRHREARATTRASPGGNAASSHGGSSVKGLDPSPPATTAPPPRRRSNASVTLGPRRHPGESSLVASTPYRAPPRSSSLGGWSSTSIGGIAERAMDRVFVDAERRPHACACGYLGLTRHGLCHREARALEVRIERTETDVATAVVSRTGATPRRDDPEVP